MCSTGTASGPWEIAITLIAVRFQISFVTFQKLLCMAVAPGREIAIQNDFCKPVLTASEQPYERLSLSSAAFLFQYLDSRLIFHCKTTFQ